MSIEPLSFSIFGVKIDSDQIEGMRESMAKAYQTLSQSNESTLWKDTDFCKRQMVSLWGGIMETLSATSDKEIPTGIEKFQKNERSHGSLSNRLNVDRDNQGFLSIFGKQLMQGQVISRIIDELSELKVEKGSIRVHFRDRLSGKSMEARIEMGKMLKQLKKESRKIETALRHFVEWAKESKRPILTCSMVAGVLLTSIVAVSFAGGFIVPIIGIKLFIMASLAIVCTIYEIYGTFNTLSDVKSALSRRVGLSFREI